MALHGPVSVQLTPAPAGKTTPLQLSAELGRAVEASWMVPPNVAGQGTPTATTVLQAPVGLKVTLVDEVSGSPICDVNMPALYDEEMTLAPARTTVVPL